MTGATILFVDNDEEFLQTWREFLEQDGYQVFPAFDSVEAEVILDKRQIDLVILDIRLVNNDDKEDFSGLNLAKRIALAVPKIILTRFPTWIAVREALGSQLDGLSPAIDFVAKQDGPQALLTAIRKVLKFKSRFSQTIDTLSDMLEDDYESAREQAKVNFWASLVVSVIGIIIVFVGVGLWVAGRENLGISSTIGGIISATIGLLFFARADAANKRMDRYHNELVSIRRFDNLLAACDEMTTHKQQDVSKEAVVRAATKSWFGEGKPDLSLQNIQVSTDKE